MEIINHAPIKIFTGNKHKELAEKVAKNLGLTLGKTFFKEFAEGELLTHQDETVRDCDVIVIFQVEMVPNILFKDIFECLSLVRGIREGTPAKIRLILPLIPFSRQDRPSKQREFSTFKLFCDMLYTAGADEVYTLHLHNMATTGFFGQIGSKTKMENVTLNEFFTDLIVKEIPKINGDDWKMASPDISAGKNARGLAKRLNMNIKTVIVDKEREANEASTKVMEVIGDPKDSNVIFFDDMIASGGSCEKAAAAVRELGAKDLYMLAPHLVYSEKTWDNLAKANFKEIWVTDTCPIPAEKIPANMKVFSVAKLVAQIIDNAHNGKSVSDIWHNGNH